MWLLRELSRREDKKGGRDGWSSSRRCVRSGGSWMEMCFFEKGIAVGCVAANRPSEVVACRPGGVVVVAMCRLCSILAVGCLLALGDWGGTAVVAASPPPPQGPQVEAGPQHSLLIRTHNRLPPAHLPNSCPGQIVFPCCAPYRSRRIALIALNRQRLWTLVWEGLGCA